MDYRGYRHIDFFLTCGQTLVSMSTYFILRDPAIFPEPSKFMPERWDLCPEELYKLEKYLLPASKGTLGCLGQK
jgi:cytochrome P450